MDFEWTGNRRFSVEFTALARDQRDIDPHTAYWRMTQRRHTVENRARAVKNLRFLRELDYSNSGTQKLISDTRCVLRHLEKDARADRPLWLMFRLQDNAGRLRAKPACPRAAARAKTLAAQLAALEAQEPGTAAAQKLFDTHQVPPRPASYRHYW